MGQVVVSSFSWFFAHSAVRVRVVAAVDARQIQQQSSRSERKWTVSNRQECLANEHEELKMSATEETRKTPLTEQT